MTVSKTRRVSKKAKSQLPREELRVISFMIADAAEVANGKVSVLGGAWDQMQVATFPTIHHRLALVIVVSVPWSDTNREHPVTINLLDEDARPIISQPLTGGFTVGRPVTTAPGDPLNVPMVVNVDNLRIECEGRLTFVLEIDGQERARTSFRARKQA